MIIILKKFLSLPRNIKQIIMIIFDIFAIELSIILSYSLRQASFFIPSGDVEKLVYIAPFIAVPIFYFFGLYQSVVRFMGIKAFLLIIYSVTLYMMLWSSIGYFVNVEVPRSVLIYHDNGTIYEVSEYFSGFFVLCIINWMICCLLIGSSRLIIRQIFWGVRKGFFDLGDDRKNIIIYGSGVAGIQLANALYFSRELKPVAFIDDNPNLVGKEIINLKVFPFSDLYNLMSKYQAKEILIAIPSIGENKKNILIDKLKDYAIKVSFLPGIRQLEKTGIRLEHLRSVKIEDILGRDRISPKKHLLEKNINNKIIMVTGAGGSIGSELCKQIVKLSPSKLILYEQNEFNLFSIEKDLFSYNRNEELEIIPVLGDVCNKIKLLNVMKKYKINTIFHAAAYKHVSMVERNPFEAFENNVVGTLISVEAALEMNIQNFVLISTDKAVRPTNFMGATKRFSELIVQSLSERKNTNFSVVRFGNVLGSSGSVIPIFEEQIKSGGPVTVRDKNVTRYFMTLEEASQLVIQASSIKADGNIFVLDMGKPIKILDLAKKMIELSGLSWSTDENKIGDIKILFTGLRPGEKIFEELSIGNKIKKTEHPKIMSLEEEFIPFLRLKKILEKYSKLNKSDDISSLLSLISEIVFDYNPDKNLYKISK